jgi:SAM-dependent methyltransferase
VPTRAAELLKYERAYTHPDYRMGDLRRAHITDHLNRVRRGSLLDVSTGRGEVLGIARALGYRPVIGTEAVSYLCNDDDIVPALAHSLPFDDKSFDVVTMFDVMEHLIAEDTEMVCRELARVARRTILLTIHNGPHRYRKEDLHINLRASYETWHHDLRLHFAPFTVVRHGLGQSISEMFEVSL